VFNFMRCEEAAETGTLTDSTVFWYTPRSGGHGLVIIIEGRSPCTADVKALQMTSMDWKALIVPARHPLAQFHTKFWGVENTEGNDIDPCGYEVQRDVT
jgi:hypothetical protein